MPSTQEFRRRIKSVTNTRQITKAMEMVASVKMQKAQKTITNGRTYIQTAWNILELLSKMTSPDSHPLLNQRKTKKTALLVINSDRGLCSGFNSDIFKKAVTLIEGKGENGFELNKKDLRLISVGKKGNDYFKRFKDLEVIAEFQDFGKEITYEETTPISKLLIDGFRNKEFDKVIMVYSHFESSLNQTPVIKQLLPITKEHIDIPELWEKKSEEMHNSEFKIEPNPDQVLDKIIPQFLRMQIFGAMLESNASEHSARMVAMKSATDNAKDLIDDLTLTYNTIRQNSITSEISEISAAAEAMS